VGRVAAVVKIDLRQRVLGLPRGYELFQRLVGAPRSKEYFVEQHVRAKPGDRVLDLGSGTGAMLYFLPGGVRYTGVEIDPGYVERATEAFKGRGEFVCADITAYQPTSEFDLVIAYGVLHHLDDAQVLAAIDVAHRALRPGGRALFDEPCRREGQGRLEQIIMDRDRGAHIRAIADYVGLVSNRFAEVSTDLDTNHYRIPYSSIIIEATR
jgi:SAM-dependent methyltransferase